MSDDPIRALLASLPVRSMIERPPQHDAILCSDVTAAGFDLDAVRAWVEDHGGYIDRTRPIVSRSLGPRYGREYPGSDFYAIPREALGK